MFRLMGFMTLALATAMNAGAASPTDVVSQSFAVTKKGDWAAYTQMTHPEALAAAKRMFRAVVAVDTTGRVGDLFFGVNSLEQFDALSDAAAYTALWQNLTTKLPVLGDAIRSAEDSIIGTVPEGADVVHVVCRESASTQGISMSKVSVITVKKSGEDWKLMLAGNFDGLAARLGQFAKAIPAPPKMQ